MMQLLLLVFIIARDRVCPYMCPLSMHCYTRYAGESIINAYEVAMHKLLRCRIMSICIIDELLVFQARHEPIQLFMVLELY